MSGSNTVARQTCLNCGQALTGRFCANCGQRDVPAYPTVHELASDAFHEVSGWDGRFATTIRTLINKPGELTLEFLRGKRRSHVSPIRLYLVASLVYFLVSAAAPNPQPNTAVVETGGIKIGVFTPDPQSRPGQAQQAVKDAQAGELTEEERREALAQIDSAPAVIRPILRRAIDDPKAVQRGIRQAMPRALFALLPVFAGILALFYRRRNYPEHLYFAIHLHAFIFTALTVSELSKMTGSVPIATAVGVTALLWIVYYSFAALRRVYGGSRMRTIAKGSLIGVVYALAATPVLIGLLAWAALRG